IMRISWLALAAVATAVIDMWSVFADRGITNQLLESADGDYWLDLLLFTGPSVDGSVLFAFGTTDLIFLALYIAWSHDWRVDLRFVAVLLTAGMIAAMLTSHLTSTTIPALPFLSVAMLVVLAVLLRRS